MVGCVLRAMFVAVVCVTLATADAFCPTSTFEIFSVMEEDIVDTVDTVEDTAGWVFCAMFCTVDDVAPAMLFALDV